MTRLLAAVPLETDTLVLALEAEYARLARLGPLAYASPTGRAFLDRALYLPAGWAADAARRTEAGVPPAVRFATKGTLARAMLQRAFAVGVPAAWVVGDTVYGTDRTLR